MDDHGDRFPSRILSRSESGGEGRRCHPSRVLRAWVCGVVLPSLVQADLEELPGLVWFRPTDDYWLEDWRPENFQAPAPRLAARSWL